MEPASTIQFSKYSEDYSTNALTGAACWWVEWLKEKTCTIRLEDQLLKDMKDLARAAYPFAQWGSARGTASVRQATAARDVLDKSARYKPHTPNRLGSSHSGEARGLKPYAVNRCVSCLLSWPYFNSSANHHLSRYENLSNSRYCCKTVSREDERL